MKFYLKVADEHKCIYNDVSIINEVFEVDENTVRYADNISNRYINCPKQDLIEFNSDKVKWYWLYKERDKPEIKITTERLSRAEVFKKFDIDPDHFNKSWLQFETPYFEGITPVFSAGFIIINN